MSITSRAPSQHPLCIVVGQVLVEFREENIDKRVFTRLCWIQSHRGWLLSLKMKKIFTLHLSLQGAVARFDWYIFVALNSVSWHFQCMFSWFLWKTGRKRTCLSIFSNNICVELGLRSLPTAQREQAKCLIMKRNLRASHHSVKVNSTCLNKCLLNFHFYFKLFKNEK